MRPSGFLCFSLIFIAVMFLPRAVAQGMFGDGLLYASMARNMAEGRGSLWAPFFSSGYWLDYVKPVYYENLPGMLWAEAVFFRILGDHWWVEKLFSALVLCLNAWLIARIWAKTRRHLGLPDVSAWLPLCLWYIIAPVAWGYPNNLMDCFQAIFCLAATLLLLDACFYSHEKRPLPWLAAGAAVFAGVLAKGPVGLYPVAVPLVFALVFEPKIWQKRLLQSLAVAATAGAGLLALWFFWPSAQAFLREYWQQRLLAVLAGTRTDAALTGLARLEIFRLLAVEMLPLHLVAGGIFAAAKFRKNAPAAPAAAATRGAWFFLLMGLAATLPIVASARQNAIYILPAMPMFALAASCWALRFFGGKLAAAEQNEPLQVRFWKISAFSAVVLVVYCAAIFGQPGREKPLLADLPHLQKHLPAGAKVGACPAVMEGFMEHTYLQRFHRLELTRDWSAVQFVLVGQESEAALTPALAARGFEKTPLLPLSRFALYHRK